MKKNAIKIFLDKLPSKISYARNMRSKFCECDDGWKPFLPIYIEFIF